MAARVMDCGSVMVASSAGKLRLHRDDDLAPGAAQSLVLEGVGQLIKWDHAVTSTAQLPSVRKLHRTGFTAQR